MICSPWVICAELALLLGFWNQASGQPPAIGANKGIVKQPNRGQGSNQSGQADKRGTKEFPFVVDTEGHQQTEQERTEANAEKQRVRGVESDTLFYARFSAWASFALTIIGAGGVGAAVWTLSTRSNDK